MDTTPPPGRYLALTALHDGPTLRPIDTEHVHLLSQILPRTPPIAVTVEGVVVDGAHRVAAARQLGWTHIPVVTLAIADSEVFATRVRLNNAHGLTLTMDQRKQAARRLLTETPPRSAAAIAMIVGISPSTVRRIQQTECPGASLTDVDTVRVGIDGKHYPTDIEARRTHARELLRARPEASSREIGRLTSLSPSTVSNLRTQLATQPQRLGLWHRLARWLRARLSRQRDITSATTSQLP